MTSFLFYSSTCKKQLYEIESQRSVTCVATSEFGALGRSLQYKLVADIAVSPTSSHNHVRTIYARSCCPGTWREPALCDPESFGRPPRAGRLVADTGKCPCHRKTVGEERIRRVRRRKGGLFRQLYRGVGATCRGQCKGVPSAPRTSRTPGKAGSEYGGRSHHLSRCVSTGIGSSSRLRLWEW